jgi:hypothetical protein
MTANEEGFIAEELPDLRLHTDEGPQIIRVMAEGETVWEGDAFEYGRLLDELRGVVKISPDDILGNRYEDEASGFRGVAVEAIFEVGEVVKVKLETSLTKDNLRRQEWFNLLRLKQLDQVNHPQGLYL